MASGVFITASLGIYQQVLLLYAAELFPPLLRGKVPAFCFATNRASSILVPITMLPLLVKVGEAAVLVVIGGAMALSALCLLALTLRRTTPNPVTA